MKLYRLIIISFLFCFHKNLINTDYEDEGFDSEEFVNNIDIEKLQAREISEADYEDKNIDLKMYEAIAISDTNKVLSLLSKGANPNSTGRFETTNLVFAISQNNIKIVDLLLSWGAKPNFRANPYTRIPLIAAIDQRNLAMIELLLKYKADPSYQEKCCDHSPVEYAQMMLGYPAPLSKLHPIVALLLKSVEEQK